MRKPAVWWQRGWRMRLAAVAGVVEGLRACLFYDRAPNAEYTLVAGLASCCYLVGAFLLFKRLETGFADVS